MVWLTSLSGLAVPGRSAANSLLLCFFCVARVPFPPARGCGRPPGPAAAGNTSCGSASKSVRDRFAFPSRRQWTWWKGRGACKEVKFHLVLALVAVFAPSTRGSSHPGRLCRGRRTGVRAEPDGRRRIHTAAIRGAMPMAPPSSPGRYGRIRSPW